MRFRSRLVFPGVALVLWGLSPLVPFARAATLSCQVEPAQPILGQPVRWQLRATDSPQTLPTWTAANFGPDWLLHAQSTSSSGDGKGHSTQVAEVTLYPMRSGELALPALELAGSRCAVQAVQVASHAPGEQPLYLATHINPAQPMVGEPVRIELDVDSAGGLSWDPIAAEAADASLRSLPTLATAVEVEGGSVPVERHAWSLLPWRAGETHVHFPKIAARRFGQLLIYPPQSLELRVRLLPAYWPANLPVGRPQIALQPAPQSLRIGQAAVLRFLIRAPGLTARMLGQILDRQATPEGLRFHAPRIHPVLGPSGEGDGRWQVDWPLRAISRGLIHIHYPLLRIPYMDPQLAAPQLAQASWGRVQVTDPRPRNLLVGLMGATALLAGLALARFAYCALCQGRKRLKWARLAQNQDVEGLNQLWEQSRGRYPSHAGQAHTLRAWLEQQAETVPGVAKELNALLARAEVQRYGPSLTVL